MLIKITVLIRLNDINQAQLILAQLYPLKNGKKQKQAWAELSQAQSQLGLRLANVVI